MLRWKIAVQFSPRGKSPLWNVYRYLGQEKRAFSARTILQKISPDIELDRPHRPPLDRETPPGQELLCRSVGVDRRVSGVLMDLH